MKSAIHAEWLIILTLSTVMLSVVISLSEALQELLLIQWKSVFSCGAKISL